MGGRGGTATMWHSNRGASELVSTNGLRPTYPRQGARAAYDRPEGSILMSRIEPFDRHATKSINVQCPGAAWPFHFRFAI
jgi:hypothetical protein